MDLQLYLRVLWRFRLLIVTGFLLALALALLTHVRVSFDGAKPRFEYREQLVYEATARVFVTQLGAPWAKTVLGESEAVAQGRLPNLALIYSSLAESDEVFARLGPIDGGVDASVVRGADRRDLTPFIEFTGISASPQAAASLPLRHYEAFLSFLEEEQAANRVPPAERVQVSLIQAPAGAILVSDRALTKPIVVFLAVMIAVIGLAFVLENLRPRVRRVATGEPPDVPVVAETPTVAERVRKTRVAR